MEETTKLKGRIMAIISPSKGDFSFEDSIVRTIFILKSYENGENIKCLGETFPIFKGAEVVLEGKFVKTGYGIEFKFNNIKLDFLKSKKSVSYFKFIVGEKNYENVIKYVRFHYDLKNLKEIENKANSILLEALEDSDVEFLKTVTKIKHLTIAKNFVKRHKVNKEFQPAFEKLSKYGLTVRDVMMFLKTEKNVSKIVEAVEKNPYKLISVANVPFKKADMIFAKNNGKTTAKQRILASIFEALKIGYEEDGNVFLREDELISNVFRALQEDYFSEHENVDIKQIKEAINKLVSGDHIVLEKGRFYLQDSYKMQEFLKDFCRKAKDAKPYNYDVKDFIAKYEKEHNITLGNEQKQSVHDAVNHKIHIITGGAGVGKTSSLACILSYFLDVLGYKEEEICLVAPTGKASQRMTESVNKQIGGTHKPIIANTIHSTLKVKPRSGNLDVFTYNESNKMNCRIVVCDETSMNDYKISYSLLSAIKDDCRVIFLGDIGQLEPVGAGFFFRDAIESKVPTTYLNEIHRQKGKSTIISLSQAIRKELFTNDNLEKQNDFLMVEMGNDYDKNIDFLVKMFMRSVEKAGIDQTMIITPLRGDYKAKESDMENKKLDSRAISIAIQKKYLPDKEGEVVISKGGFDYKIGSKIIITKNNHEKGLINGAIGYITEIDKETSSIVAEFDGEEKILVSEDINHIRLGYAITVHKSQGSDWKNVIYICSKETNMNTKNLAYTAITRAKENLVIFGNKSVVEKSQRLYPKRKNSILLNER